MKKKTILLLIITLMLTFVLFACDKEIKPLFEHKEPNISTKSEVSIDDGPFERKKGLIVALCNGQNIGGGIQICPIANPNDAYLDFMFVSCFKKITLPKKLIQLMSGKIFKFQETQHIKCKKAVFKDEKNVTLQIDGNITREYNEYRCEIVEKGINMYL